MSKNLDIGKVIVQKLDMLTSNEAKKKMILKDLAKDQSDFNVIFFYFQGKLFSLLKLPGKPEGIKRVYL